MAAARSSGSSMSASASLMRLAAGLHRSGVSFRKTAYDTSNARAQGNRTKCQNAKTKQLLLLLWHTALGDAAHSYTHAIHQSAACANCSCILNMLGFGARSSRTAPVVHNDGPHGTGAFGKLAAVTTRTLHALPKLDDQNSPKAARHRPDIVPAVRMMFGGGQW